MKIFAVLPSPLVTFDETITLNLAKKHLTREVLFCRAKYVV